jgi:cytoskeleton protein RodZ
LSAGALLRQARKAQGLHLAAIAASIKVTPQKLEALENDRIDQLPDAAFARALAQAVCRVLKIDPQPVLERLPQGISHRLERLEGGLNQPFRAHAGGPAEPRDWSLLSSPAVWGPALLVIGAVVLLLVPFDFTRRIGRGAESVATNEGAVPAAPATSAVPAAPVLSAPAPAPVEPPPDEAHAQASAPGGGGLLAMRATADSWVEVRDAGGQVLAQPQLRDAPRTLLVQGVCQARAGDMAAAERTLQRAFEVDPANVAVQVNLAEVLLRRGEFERARFYIGRVNKERDQSTAQTLWLAARIEQAAGQRRAADELGTQLKNRFPQSREAAAFEQGRFDE